MIALSPGMRTGIIDTGTPADKVIMIPNSADLYLFQPGPVDTEFLAEKGLSIRPTIAYTGTLGKANAIDILGEVAVRLHEINANVQILVAGDGQYRRYLEDLIKGYNLKNLVLLGKISSTM